MSELAGKTAVVIGGSKGLGRGIVDRLANEGMRVVAIARHEATYSSENVMPLMADMTDEGVVQEVVERERPYALIINGGARPTTSGQLDLDWETFSINWNTDVKGTFLWAKAALCLPLDPGSHLIIVSSGAAVGGSPVSGGYSPAKAGQWILAQNLAAESQYHGLGIHVQCLLPMITPETEIGQAGIAAYAARNNITPEAFMERVGAKPPLSPAIMGEGIHQLLTDASLAGQITFRISGQGLAAM